SLEAVSLNGVGTLFHESGNDLLSDFHHLQRLHLVNLQFSPPIQDLLLQALPLRVIQIKQTNLGGKFAFVPTSCPDENSDKIILDLRDNHLKSISLDALFPAGTPTCAYHIELAGNPWNADLLTSQIEVLER